MTVGSGTPIRTENPHLSIFLSCPRCGATSNLAMVDSLELLTKVIEHLKRGECVAIHSGQLEAVGQVTEVKGQ
jgi:hypothetical protein